MQLTFLDKLNYGKRGSRVLNLVAVYLQLDGICVFLWSSNF